MGSFWRSKKLDQSDRWILSALFATQIFTFYHWILSDSEGVLLDVLAYQTKTCWPMFPACREVRELFSLVAVPLAYISLALAGIGICASLVSNKIRPLIFLSLSLLGLKYSIILQDYSLMGNFNYIVLFLWLNFLFVDKGLSSFKIVLVAFYMAAGLLKFNLEWLSGSILSTYLAQVQAPLRSVPLAVEWLPVLPALNIFVELLVAPLMLVPDRWISRLSLALLTGFHLVSFGFVGITFPFTMLTLLAPLWFVKSTEPISLVRTAPLSWLTGLALLLMQIPSFVMSKDAALTNAGRIWSVNMLDAHPICRNFLFFKNTDQSWIDASGLRTDLGPRIQCDPVVSIEMAKDLCLAGADANSISALGLFSRRSHALTAQEIFRIPRFCSQLPHMSVLGKDPWISL